MAVLSKVLSATKTCFMYKQAIYIYEGNSAAGFVATLSAIPAPFSASLIFMLRLGTEVFRIVRYLSGWCWFGIGPPNTTRKGIFVG